MRMSALALIIVQISWTQPVHRLSPQHIPNSSTCMLITMHRPSPQEQMITGLTGVFKRLNTFLPTIFPCCKCIDYKIHHHVNITLCWASIPLADMSAVMCPNFRNGEG